MLLLCERGEHQLVKIMYFRPWIPKVRAPWDVHFACYSLTNQAYSFRPAGGENAAYRTIPQSAGAESAGTANPPPAGSRDETTTSNPYSAPARRSCGSEDRRA